MSTFLYYCAACKLDYEEERSIGTDHPQNCPHCNEPFGDNFHVNFAKLNVTLGKGIIPVTTFGQQSEINKKRLGKELLAKEVEDFAKKDPRCIKKKFEENLKNDFEIG